MQSHPTPLPNDHTHSLWNRVDQHSAQIAQMQRDQGRVEGRLDSVESQLNRFQEAVMNKLDKMDSKQDQSLAEMRTIMSQHSDQLSKSDGTKNTLMWVSATAISVVLMIVAVWNTMFGG